MKPELGVDFIPQGSVQLPPSKSIANRLLVMAALAGSKGPVQRNDEADDTRIMRRILQQPEDVVDVGMAGTVCRFITAWLCLQSGSYTLTGHQRMLERPIGILVDVLRRLGAEIEYIEKENYLPLKISGGTLSGGEVTIAGDVSSQYLSALLMIAPYMKNGLSLTIEKPLYSEPYVRMTTQLMQRSGATVKWEDNVIVVSHGGYTRVPFTVESDWSAAAFFYALLALSGRGTITLQYLYKNSLQGDSRCIALFKHFGIITTFLNDAVRIEAIQKRLLPDFIAINCSDCPDLVQPLACTCAGLKVRAKFTGVKSLRIKETNRVEALKMELKKLGVEVQSGPDELELTGFGKATDFNIRTYNDHRMAMAFAPLSVCFPELVIEEPEVVSKSFPNFWKALKGLKPASKKS